MRTRVSRWRSAQARYLLALHDQHRIELDAAQELLLTRIALAGHQRRRLPSTQIRRLAHLMRTLDLAPAATHRRSPGGSP